MKISRDSARVLQKTAATQGWWPGDLPAWSRLAVADLQEVNLDDAGEECEDPALWQIVAYTPERVKTTYRLCLVDGGAETPLFRCENAAEVVKFRDELTYETGADQQSLAEWFKWIARTDALAAANPTSAEWSGGGIDIQLERAGANVVAMGEQSALLSVFGSVAAIKEWMTRLHPAPLVGFDVAVFDAHEWFGAQAAQSEQGLVLLEFHEYGRGDDASGEIAVKWVRAAPKPTSARTWYSTFDNGLRPAWLSADTDNGHDVTAYTAERCTPWSGMEPYLRPEFSAETPKADRWVAVRMTGMPTGIAIPCDGSMMVCFTDRDGASFGIHAEEAETFLHRARADQEFQLRWGRWLNTDVVLEPEELARGIAYVESALKEQA